MTTRAIVFLLLVLLLTKRSCLSQENTEEINGPLYLTPYLEEGKISEAQQLAKVNLSQFPDINSYSGFLNVNKTHSSEMFFWYVSSASSQNNPVILWLQGGPGITGLRGFFDEHGPFYYSGEWIRRNVSWHKLHHMIYVDNPVGSGFSHTSEEGYCTDVSQVSENLYTFILQFLKLFPDLRKNEFYLVGESCAGQFILTLTHMIHERNSQSLLINLTGISIGNPFIDPINQISYGSYLYSFGLLDKVGVKKFKELEDKCIEHMNSEKWIEAAEIFKSMFLGNNSLFYNTTGFHQYHNTLEWVSKIFHYSEFLQNDELLKAIHVGNITSKTNDKVEEYLLPDLLKSITKYLAEALNHYNVILYAGQMDIIVPYPTVRNVLRKLHFSSSKEWSEARREPWAIERRIIGLHKSAENLTEIMIIGAGHSPPMDQPEATLEVIKRLTNKV